jgi:hypothetical protein
MFIRKLVLFVGFGQTFFPITFVSEWTASVVEADACQILNTWRDVAKKQR